METSISFKAEVMEKVSGETGWCFVRVAKVVRHLTSGHAASTSL